MLNAKLMISTALAATLATASAVAAATTAAPVTDLNMRMGPGPMYQIEAVIPAAQTVDVTGCLATADWCKVSFDDHEGWVYSPYLTFDGKTVATTETVSKVTVIDENADDAAAMALLGSTTGAAIGALIGGPVAIAVGAVAAGVAAGTSVEPDVTVYVRENPVDPVILTGEAVVGAGIPEGVTVYDVPSNDKYAYLNVNGDLVLIDKETRKITTIVR